MREGEGDPNTVFNLIGFCCVSLDREDALKKAEENTDPDLYPVVFEMPICNRYGQFFFKLDDYKYSSYFKDEELVLWDGLPYLVLSVKEGSGGETAASETF